MTIPCLCLVIQERSSRTLRLVTLLILAALVLLTPSTTRAADSGFRSAEVTAVQFFDPLEHNVVNVAGEFTDGTPYEAKFLDNFTQTGGIERWGYPTSADFEESSGTLTQYYQRGVIDWQPPPGGGDHTFQRRLAWDYLGGGLGGSTDLGVELHLTNPNPGDLLGPWGHKVANTSVDGVPIGFADFFHRLGGVASFGFPKTDARQDDHPQAVLHTPGRPVDGRIRQYFQSVVVEYHPESPASPVKLSLLGDTLRDARYPRGTWQQYLAFGPEAPLAVGDQLNLGPARRGPHGSTVEDVAEFLEPSLLRVTTDRACGSGFFVTSSGYALTTWNLVSDAGLISVESPRGYAATAHLVAGDADRDIALLKVPGHDHIPVTWADVRGVAVGIELVALGYDAGRLNQGRAVDCQSRPTTTSVVVSSPDRPEGQHFLPSVDIGNGGGPIATKSGHVVGPATSVLPGFPRADRLAPVTVVRPLVESWIQSADRGQMPALPHRPRFDRIVMAEHHSLPCPGGGGVEVRGSRIELTTTVSLNPERIPIGIIRLRNAYDDAWQSDDQINFGPISVDGSTISMLSWTRNHLGTHTVVKSGWNTAIASGAPFHLRFAYDGGSVGLFINGTPVHQEVGLPYGDHIWLKLECFGSTGIPPMYYSDLRVVGMPLPQN